MNAMDATGPLDMAAAGATDAVAMNATDADYRRCGYARAVAWDGTGVTNAADDERCGRCGHTAHFSNADVTANIADKQETQRRCGEIAKHQCNAQQTLLQRAPY